LKARLHSHITTKKRLTEEFELAASVTEDGVSCPKPTIQRSSSSDPNLEPIMSLTTLLLTPYTLLLLPVLYYLLPYIRNWQIRSIPAPLPAAFTNLWLLAQCRQGKRYLAVHAAHAKYGKLVRIQPHHVSVADADAIPQIYGHGNGFLKSEYYDAFVSIRRGLFNTRDRAEHTRKRKTVSHTFSAKSVGQFEQYIHHNLEELQKQWDIRADEKKGEWYQMDALHW
jgi:benzoate 4-monooxygenase